jgi:hypoxanthine phosphoribosyltransferase
MRWKNCSFRPIRSGLRPTYLVAMWRGGSPIGIAVQEVLEYHAIEVDHIAIRTSSYLGIDQQYKTVRVHAVDYLVSRLSAEDQLLLIDDVFDSGRSLEAVIAELKRRCRRNLPEMIRIATVYYKPTRNRSTLVPDYYVHATDCYWLRPGPRWPILRARWNPLRSYCTQRDCWTWPRGASSHRVTCWFRGNALAQWAPRFPIRPVRKPLIWAMSRCCPD